MKLQLLWQDLRGEQAVQRVARRTGCGVETFDVGEDIMTRRYTVERGAYTGTSDDRLDRWYVKDTWSDVVNRTGGGYVTKREAEYDARLFSLFDRAAS